MDGLTDGKSHIELGTPPNNQIITASYTDEEWYGMPLNEDSTRKSLIME